jgi:pimeloyl-ACP methyl ester carboxylesterase
VVLFPLRAVLTEWRTSMPFVRANGLQLCYEQTGASGPPVVFVHGSWGNHHNWDRVVPRFAERYRVVTYDRRGHSQSERPPGQGSVNEDAADLATLIEVLDLAPAHVIGNSFGAVIALRTAATRPELFRSLVVHEPPAFDLLDDDDRFTAELKLARERVKAVRERLATGDMEGGAQLFVETIAFGPGFWDHLPDPVRQTFIENALTWIDETNDPEAGKLPLDQIARFDRPTLLSHGGQSAPFFPAIVTILRDTLPHAQTHFYAEDGHVPHNSNPDAFVTTVTGFIDTVS